MNNLPTRSVLAAFLLMVPACLEDDVAELGVFGGGVKENPAEPTVGDSSVAIPIIDVPALPDLVCHRFQAHAAGSTAPYPVGAGANESVRFTFSAPWEGTTYIHSIKPIAAIGSPAHHWLLSADTGALPAGVQVVDEIKQDGPVVAAWIPGTEPLQLPYDYGIPVHGDVSYSLAVRYTNTSGAASLDTSGVEICVSPKPVFFGVSISVLEQL